MMDTGLHVQADHVWQESMRILEQMPGLPAEQYGAAVGKLLQCPNPGIRQRALAIGSAFLEDGEVVRLLRESADDVLRNAGLEILKLRNGRGFSLASRLLDDPDPDVVLQAVLALDHLRDPRAVESLCVVLKRRNPNIVQAALVAIGHLGDSRIIATILPFLTAGSWIKMATVQALGDIRSKKAVKPLQQLLDDPFVGTLAAEALARIGGASAFKALAGYWMQQIDGIETAGRADDVDADTTLGLMAHVIGGLSWRPAAPDGLRPLLIERISEANSSEQAEAAECILALGPGDGDSLALTILRESITESHKDPCDTPACLLHREDLIPFLLSSGGAAKSWGFKLAVRHPNSITPRDLAVVLSETGETEPLDAVSILLRKKRSPELAAPLLNLYLRLAPEDRDQLSPAIKLYKTQLKELVNELGYETAVSRSNLDPETHVVIAALLGTKSRTIVQKIDRLSFDAKVRVIRQLLDHPKILQQLPWNEWVTVAPELAYPLLANVAMAAGLSELLPILRSAFAEELPEPAVIRAVGALKDRESIASLIRCLDSECPLTRTLALDSLGRIGNSEGRRAIQKFANQADYEEAHIAYLALAHCATEEELEFLIEGCKHPYWAVRLAVVEGLDSLSMSAGLTALVPLCVDPFEAVAARALKALGR